MAYIPVAIASNQPWQVDKDYVNGAIDPGIISGTVKTQTDATHQVGTYCKVVLIRDSDLVAVRSMMADPVTGAYLFRNIDKGVSYTVIAYHPTGSFRAVISDGLYPT